MVLALAGLSVAIAAPTPTGGDPAVMAAASPSPTPKATREPKPVRSHVPSETVELRGMIRTATGEDGRVAYELVDAAGAVWRLEVGPPWWWGTADPLAAYAGRTVTVTGERPLGEQDVDVLAIDGKTVREAGRPPWAGGWRAVGERHPGWTRTKADRWEAKQAAKLERCSGEHPPGYCRQLRVPTAP